MNGEQVAWRLRTLTRVSRPAGRKKQEAAGCISPILGRPKPGAAGRGAQDEGRLVHPSRATHPGGVRRHVQQHHTRPSPRLRGVGQWRARQLRTLLLLHRRLPWRRARRRQSVPAGRADGDPEYIVRPLFVSVSPAVTIADDYSTAA